MWRRKDIIIWARMDAFRTPPYISWTLFVQRLQRRRNIRDGKRTTRVFLYVSRKDVLCTIGKITLSGLLQSHANYHDIRSGIFRGRVMDISTGRLIVELKCSARRPDLIVNHFYRALLGGFYDIQLYIHICIWCGCIELWVVLCIIWQPICRKKERGFQDKLV